MVYLFRQHVRIECLLCARHWGPARDEIEENLCLHVVYHLLAVGVRMGNKYRAINCHMVIHAMEKTRAGKELAARGVVIFELGGWGKS